VSGPSVTTLRLGDTIPPAAQPNVMEERASALDDFLATNNCKPLRDGEPILGDGPFDLCIEKMGNNLGLVFSRAGHTGTAYTVSFSLSPLRKALKDYTQIVESYYTAILSGQASRVEAIDMTRRSIHNEAAEILTERLGGKLAMDHDTARRFVTIINSLRYDGKGGNR